MELSEIITSFVYELRDEFEKDKNIEILKKGVLRPIIKEVVGELYPYILKTVIFLFIFLLAIIILIILNIRVIYS